MAFLLNHSQYMPLRLESKVFHGILQDQASTAQKPAIHAQRHQNVILAKPRNYSLWRNIALAPAFIVPGRIRQACRRNPIPSLSLRRLW
tara:strand:+ start:87 stop:353 length:267 start_codon:yes stop_codon:yes gene_type:complete